MLLTDLNNSMNIRSQYSLSMRGAEHSVKNVKYVNGKGELKNDTVELSSKKEKKKGLSKGAKRTLIMGSVLATTILALKFGPRVMAAHNVKKRLPIRNLPEKLDFTEAKTIEEARKYTTEVLQIKEVDEGISLEALNLVNKGLTDVSNAQKGKVVMPTALRLSKMKDANAGISSSLCAKDLGEMLLNDKLFSLDDFDDFASKNLKMPDGKNIFYKNAQGEYKSRYIYDKCFKPKFDENVSKLLDKFYQNPESLTNSEKLSLKFILGQGFSNQSVSNLKPRVLLAKFKEDFNKRGIDYNLSDFDGKTDNEMIKFITEKVVPVLENSNDYVSINLNLNSQFGTIYHEMGHLQDINKNYGVVAEKMDFLKALKTKLSPSINHFAKKTEDEVANLLKTEKGRNLLKKEAPLTYEFITDKNIQDIASEVSDYATTGIGEFIAETYEHMISGKPLSQRVKDLYAKYNGPILPV